MKGTQRFAATLFNTIAFFNIIVLTGCVTITEGDIPQIDASPKEKAESRIALGLGYMENGNLVRAHDNFQQALSHDPNYYRAQLSMAHYYERVGEVKKANNLYTRSMRQHPKNGNVLNNFGTFLCKQGEFKKADKLFRQAIAQPSYYLIPASYENAALCALKAEEPKKAAVYFTRAIDHDPHRPLSILQLAKLEIESQKFTDARIRLMRFNQSYGLKKPALQLMVKLEKSAGNPALSKKYQAQLDKLNEVNGS